MTITKKIKYTMLFILIATLAVVIIVATIGFFHISDFVERQTTEFISSVDANTSPEELSSLAHQLSNGIEHTAVLMQILMIVVLMVTTSVSTIIITNLCRQIAKPIDIIAKGAMEIGQGNLNYVIPENGDDEIGILANSLNSMTLQLKHQISEQKEYERAKEEMFRAEIAHRESMERNLMNSVKFNVTENRIEEFRCTDRRDNITFTAGMTMRQAKQCFLLAVPDKSESAELSVYFSQDELLSSFNEGSRSFTFEYRRLIADGSIIWVQSTINLSQQPESGDITAFIYTRDINREHITKTVMDQIVTSDYDYFAYIDADKDIVEIISGSEHAKTLFADHQNCYSKAIIEYCNINAADDEVEQHIKDTSLEAILNALNKSDKYILNVRIKQKNELRRKKICFQYIDRTQKLIVVTRSDITDIYNEEAKRNTELNNALAQAQKANESKTDFLSNMSHEMRTPLNGIKGMLDIMQERPELAHDECLEKALISTKHLTRLINDILDMSKIESGKIELQYSLLTAEIFQGSIDAIMKPLADEKNIKYICGGIDFGGKAIVTDAGRLEQIMINLLSNGIKYTASGGKVEYSVLFSDTGNDKARLTFTVKDNGSGMSEEFQQVAFNPFEQENQTYSKSGTGLGLPITKELVELMGGKVSLNSKVGEGTTISFTIITDIEENYFSADKSGTVLRDNFASCNAIRAEDNEINREIAMYQLKKMGLTVDCAINGQEAVDLFLASEQNHYDIIFMDIMMPVKDGLTAAKEIRKAQRPDAKTVPIVAMTANAFAEDIHKSLESGMNDHLSKPFDKEQMRRVLSQQIR